MSYGLVAQGCGHPPQRTSRQTLRSPPSSLAAVALVEYLDLGILQ